MPIPTSGRHHTPSLLFATVRSLNPPTVRLTDDDAPFPIDWVDDRVELAFDARVLVAEVAPKQWAVISILAPTVSA